MIRKNLTKILELHKNYIELERTRSQTRLSRLFYDLRVQSIMTQAREYLKSDDTLYLMFPLTNFPKHLKQRYGLKERW